MLKMDEWITFDEAAKLLKLKSSTLRVYINDKKLKLNYIKKDGERLLSKKLVRELAHERFKRKNATANMKALGIQLTPVHLQKFKEIAWHRDISPAALGRKLIIAFLENPEKYNFDK